MNLNYTLLVISTLFMSGYSIVLRFAVNRCKTVAQQVMFNGMFCAFAVVLAGISCMGSFAVTSLGAWLSAFYGVFFLLTVLLNLKAVEYGPLSSTTLIVNLSLVLPILYSCLFCGERLSFVHSCGLVLLVLCLVLFAEPEKDRHAKKRSGIWFLLSISAMICNGLSSVFSKAYMEQCNGAYATQYVFWGYVSATVASFVAVGILQVKPKEKNAKEDYLLVNPAVIGLTVLISIFNFGGNFLVTRLANVIEGAVLYPFVQGGSIVVTTLFSRCFLREKLSPLKWLAILAGFASVILLSC